MKPEKTLQPQSHLTPYTETLDQALIRISADMRAHNKDCLQSFSGETIRRRHRAIRETVDQVKARHDLAALSEGFTSTAELWAVANLCVADTPEGPDKDRFISLGAAIWILDHVDGEISLPPCFEDIPDLYDPCHDDDLIRATVHLIRNRKDPDLEKEYDALISRIPEEAKAAAAKHFEEDFWIWTDHLFDFVKPLAEQIGKTVREANRLIDKYNEEIKIINSDMQDFDSRKPNPLLTNPLEHIRSSFAPVPGTPAYNNTDGFNPVNTTASSILNRYQTITSLIDRVNVLHNKIKKIRSQLYMAISVPIDLSFIHPRPYEQNHPELLGEEFPYMHIGDPYELCFAFYELERKDSPLMWLWGACMGLIIQAGKNLPWGLSPFMNYEIPVSKRPVKLPLPHMMQFYTEGQDYPVSFTQLVYNLGGGLLPRDWDGYTGWSTYLRKLGVKDAGMAIALISVFKKLRQRNVLVSAEEEKEAEEVFTSEDIGELQQKIRLLQEQLKHATEETHIQEKRARKAEQIVESERERYRSERKELAGLREVLFSFDSQEDAGTVIPLPYTVRSRIVVYGGHESWLKSMKEYTKGDIRFIDKDQAILDRAVTRNADTIWIQHNALSHSQYYAVIDEVRKWNKPVKYFLYSSAKKCVEQIAMDETE